MKKHLIITIIVAVVLGILVDQTLKQSAIDIFQARINYAGGQTCNPLTEQEVKVISLAQIRLHSEYPDPCILSINLTGKGQATYFAVISVIPLLLSSGLFLVLRRKRK